MLESIITISITGFIAGFLFAMPIAGPISILIVSNALKGRRRHSNQISVGAGFSDFVYIFIAIYGLTKLYSFYKPAIPYLFLAGSIFFFILGYKIYKNPIDFEHFEEESHITDKIRNKDKGGFYTGFMVNLLNPTQFLGGLMSSFFVISFVASLGFSTGGLELQLNNNVQEINTLNDSEIGNKDAVSFEALKRIQENNNRNHPQVEREYPPFFHLIISLFYAFFISLGGIIWFYSLTWMLTRYRKKINVRILSLLIKTFGIILIIIGLYFGYLGANRVLD